jgi:arylsulfatase
MRLLITLLGIVVLYCSVARAQKITGVPGSPSATTTINGEQIPAPLPKFGGKIERNALQSKPWWPPRIEPPKGAPNVLLIMTDDVGFGPVDFWRSHSDAVAGPDRPRRPSLH